LRGLYRSVITKRELSKTPKPPFFNCFFSLTYDRESWVVVEKLTPRVQAAGIEFLQKISRRDAFVAQLWNS